MISLSIACQLTLGSFLYVLFISVSLKPRRSSIHHNHRFSFVAIIVGCCWLQSSFMLLLLLLPSVAQLAILQGSFSLSRLLSLTFSPSHLLAFSLSRFLAFSLSRFLSFSPSLLLAFTLSLLAFSSRFLFSLSLFHASSLSRFLSISLLSLSLSRLIA